MTSNVALFLNVARKLRYRRLLNMEGERVTITNWNRIVAELAAFVGRFFDDCALDGAVHRSFVGQIAKYNLLDIWFTAPLSLLDDEAQGGVPILRELGFVTDVVYRVDGNDITPHQVDVEAGANPRCLEFLRDSIEENKAYLMLFLQADGACEPKLSAEEMMARFRDPSIVKFPIVFRVTDACVSNSLDVWMIKHFYV